MKKIIQDKIRELLTDLNNSFGIGEIVSINGELEIVTFKPWGCSARQRNFRSRLNGNKLTVRFCGHQKTVTLPVS